jgi:hypothetical protein
VIGNARFSTQSQPVGFALKDGSMRVARWRQVWFLTSSDSLSCRLDFRNSIGMVFLELLNLVVDLAMRRDAVKISRLASAFCSRHPLRVITVAFGLRWWVGARLMPWAWSDWRFTPSEGT